VALSHIQSTVVPALYVYISISIYNYEFRAYYWLRCEAQLSAWADAIQLTRETKVRQLYLIYSRSSSLSLYICIYNDEFQAYYCLRCEAQLGAWADAIQLT